MGNNHPLGPTFPLVPAFAVLDLYVVCLRITTSGFPCRRQLYGVEVQES